MSLTRDSRRNQAKRTRRTDEAILGELVTVRSASGLELDGIVYRVASFRTTIVHIHGSFGNFYQSKFLRTMAKLYSRAGVNLVSLNISGHDGVAEGYRVNDEFEYTGGALANFGASADDIEGAVQFAEGFSDRVILQGHSLGCDRVLHYVTTRKSSNDLILLAPCDSYKLQSDWLKGETVEAQIARLSETPTDARFDWLPIEEYGIRGGGDWTYPIPITRRAFLSIAAGPPFRLIRISAPARFYLPQRALIYLGGRDALQVWSHQVMLAYFRDRVDDVTEVHIPEGDHVLTGCESTVARRIVSWIKRTSKPEH